MFCRASRRNKVFILRLVSWTQRGRPDSQSGAAHSKCFLTDGIHSPELQPSPHPQSSQGWRKRGESERRRKPVPTAVESVGHSSRTETTGLQFPLRKLAKADAKLLWFLGQSKARPEPPKALVDVTTSIRERQAKVPGGRRRTLWQPPWTPSQGDKAREGTSCWQKQTRSGMSWKPSHSKQHGRKLI